MIFCMLSLIISDYFTFGISYFFSGKVTFLKEFTLLPLLTVCYFVVSTSLFTLPIMAGLTTFFLNHILLCRINNSIKSELYKKYSFSKILSKSRSVMLNSSTKFSSILMESILYRHSLHFGKSYTCVYHIYSKDLFFWFLVWI